MFFRALAAAMRVLRFPYSSILSSRRTTTPLFPSIASATVPAPDTIQAPEPKPWLLVGLGNPGRIFRKTRHNVGFEMIEAIAQAEGISMSSVQFKALFGNGLIANVPVMLAKPQTFMNASGWVSSFIF
eukprot:TRINITY_DN3222_c0_g1_i11.p1 TRINITY_DN3222_c0_g1~~TRINITY_DN3222_c0_g1_i11.p1  ORF type:complete len:128 (-),score=9.95 TRINITY_DN3222_c0_g1_i11:720-1103(-)